MEHVAWKGHIKPGYKQEYIRRHTEIWPEMVDALTAVYAITPSLPAAMNCSVTMSAYMVPHLPKKHRTKALLLLAGAR